MPLTFDDTECYHLFLALDGYAVGEPLLEPPHLGKIAQMQERLRDWYDAERVRHGHAPTRRT